MVNNSATSVSNKNINKNQGKQQFCRKISYAKCSLSDRGPSATSTTTHKQNVRINNS